MALVGLVSSSAAMAVPAATLTLANEDRFRGRPVSGGRPALTAEVAVEPGSGSYAGAAGQLFATRRDGVELLGLTAYAGVARRIGQDLVLDVGLVDRFYGRAFNGGFDVNFVEAYVGLSTQRIRSRVSLSPSYYGTGRRTLYLESDLNLSVWRRLSFQAHVGRLIPLNRVERPGFARKQYDWRAGLAHPVGRADLGLSWVSAGPRQDVIAGRPRGRGALLIALTYGF